MPADFDEYPEVQCFFRLNPCSNGMPADKAREVNSFSNFAGLNPCSNGMPADTTMADTQDALGVLILVLMECPRTWEIPLKYKML